MEEKRSPAAAAVDTPTTTTPSSRRRGPGGGGGQKRKSNNINSNNNNGNSKRHRPPPSPIPFHNGPLTRAARHLPTTNPSPPPLPPPPPPPPPDVSIPRPDDQTNKGDLLALEARFEAEYRARDPNLHLVPTHAGWFSWTRIHPLEEKMLPSFFTGKLETRSPALYLELRNWMMNRFHADPTKIMELNDLSELTVGDEDARLEVMEFLDYWGLINFHPQKQTDSAPTNLSTDADKEGEDDDSLLKSLYRFETEQTWTPVVPTTRVVTPSSMPSGIVPDSALAEELVKSEEPSVEYHCNSCSADCSRKRYHCQKQADFDLCTECFNDGKFGPDMSPSDFILMEPAEAGGASGGKWTDQETLLLLEALELYKENWSEIAEHVATKTKAQCILHFVEMPIEDTFLDCDDKTNETPGENNVGVPLSNGSPVGADGPERAESKQDTNETPSSPKTEILKTKDVKGPNISEPEDFSKNFALEALKEAFEAVGTLSPGERMSFANAGNPVMTLAAFLVRLVEPNIATAVVRNSLKSTSVSSLGELLALKHCFVLEDPPDDKGLTTGSERIIAEAVEQGSLKEENKTDTVQTGGSVDNCHEDDKIVENHKSITETPDSNDQNNGVEKTQNIQEGKQPLVPANQSIEELESGKISANECGEMPDSGKSSDQVAKETNELDSIDISKKQTDRSVELDVSSSNVELHSSANDSEDLTTLTEPARVEGSLKHESITSASDKKQSGHLSSTNTLIGEGTTGTRVPNDDVNEDPSVCKTDSNVGKIKQAAITALSAAAVKAKVLARQEEEQIQQLSALLIENQLYKLETKLSFFHEMENMVMRVREQLERSKQKLYHERAQIIASRLGISGSTSRPIAQPSQINRAAMAFANLAPRSPFIGTSLRPPVSRPMMGSVSSLLGAVPGSSVQPSNQKLPFVTNK